MGGRRGRQGDLAEDRVGEKERLERVDHRNGESSEGGNMEGKGGVNGRRELANEGGEPSLSTADGRVYTDDTWRSGGSTDSGVVTWHGGDGRCYALPKVR